MQELLLAYFRALKSPRGAALLHVILEGLAGVAPLLNSRVIGDLLEILQVAGGATGGAAGAAVCESGVGTGADGGERAERGRECVPADVIRTAVGVGGDGPVEVCAGVPGVCGCLLI